MCKILLSWNTGYISRWETCIVYPKNHLTSLVFKELPVWRAVVYCKPKQRISETHLTWSLNNDSSNSITGHLSSWPVAHIWGWTFFHLLQLLEKFGNSVSSTVHKCTCESPPVGLRPILMWNSIVFCSTSIKQTNCFLFWQMFSFVFQCISVVIFISKVCKMCKF